MLFKLSTIFTVAIAAYVCTTAQAAKYTDENGNTIEYSVGRNVTNDCPGEAFPCRFALFKIEDTKEWSIDRFCNFFREKCVFNKAFGSELNAICRVPTPAAPFALAEVSCVERQLVGGKFAGLWSWNVVDGELVNLQFNTTVVKHIESVPKAVYDAGCSGHGPQIPGCTGDTCYCEYDNSLGTKVHPFTVDGGKVKSS